MAIRKKISSDKIVLFIHGLHNKPPRKLLKRWYLKSIREGFDKKKLKKDHFRFEVIYWADLLYPLPLDPLIRDSSHPLFLDEPYVPSNEVIPKSNLLLFKRGILDKLEKFIDKLFLNKRDYIRINYLFNLLLSRTFKDLHTYYKKNITSQEKSEASERIAIRNRLSERLNFYRDKKILLIAHSMGSIIAYDVLYQIQHQINIYRLITIGSPLGLPMIKREIFNELALDYNQSTLLPTPENIQHGWFNLADLNDTVAINYSLADDYAPNSRSIAPKDIIVQNDYNVNGEYNAHKSFGYLRTEALAEILWEFLFEEEKSILNKMKSLIKLLTSK